MSLIKEKETNKERERERERKRKRNREIREKRDGLDVSTTREGFIRNASVIYPYHKYKYRMVLLIINL